MRFKIGLSGNTETVLKEEDVKCVSFQSVLQFHFLNFIF